MNEHRGKQGEMCRENEDAETQDEQAPPFTMHRLGVVMQPDPEQSVEQGGVTNPAAARGPDGRLYLLPRLVSQGNYSRVGLARVLFDETGAPRGVRRQGIVLEPSAPYEMGAGKGAVGCEDPRVTYIEALQCYVMAYAAVGPRNTHVAVAVSDDLFTWHRLGRVEFVSDRRTGEMSRYASKDAAFFPAPVIAPDGQPALALLHRPDYDERTKPAGVHDPRPSIWMSYCSLKDAQQDRRALVRLNQHHLLAHPEAAWEATRIGAGAPPVLTHLGWLLVYHGTAPTTTPKDCQQDESTYAAGVFILDRQDPRHILYRSPTPVLTPTTREELDGVKPRVVFPSGADLRENDLLDIYYGMADDSIGAARLRVPAELPRARVT